MIKRGIFYFILAFFAYFVFPPYVVLILLGAIGFLFGVYGADYD